MEGDIDMDSVLDYAVFEASSYENSFKALAFSKGVVETLAFGHLDMLVAHLPQANACLANGKCFKLQPSESIKDLSWFTKSTIARFLHLINMPEALKSANAIEREMSQLEDTRRFHLTLYSKDHHDLSTVTSGASVKDDSSMQKVKQESVPSDATKNDLLRAMDLRLMTLKDELVSVFNRATGVTLSVKLLSDLAAFSEYFGDKELRDQLMKCLSLMPKDQKVEGLVKKVNSDCTMNSDDNTEETGQTVSVIGKDIPLRNGISPAKIAQAERQSSTESESSESSDEDHTIVERSRPAIRSASPRRSASPMRRIQIGRSGSRRSTALSIKSLSYFPVRERAVSYRDGGENGSGGEESEQTSKKTDNSVRRMSVQDAISLFESKQKDQTSDIQKKRASAEAAFNINKSVLRRWSSGMGDSLVRSQENASDAMPQNISTNVETKVGEHKLSGVKAESDSLSNDLNTIAAAEVHEFSGADNTATLSEDTPELVTSQNEKINDRTNTSAEWTKQKEAELNQMLMKMMENKPGRYQTLNASYDRNVAIANEKKGGLYSQYKEKRDEKLRSENAGKHSVMEAQFKVLQETLEQTKAGVASKSRAITKKLDSSTISQKPRRNSAPPVLPKKELSKATVSRKPSSKQSTPPSTRASWSSGPLPKANGTQPTKSAPKMTSNSNTPNRQKTQLTQTDPKPVRPLRQPKGNLADKVNIKPTIKDQEEKKQKTLTAKSNKNMKVQSATKGDSAPEIAKPNIYNKKVTKKSSVVPVEVKPFLKKGSGIGPGVVPMLSKTKASTPEDLSKNNENLVQAEEKKLVDETVESLETTTRVLEVDPLQEANDVDASSEVSPDNDLNLIKPENLDQNLTSVDDSFKNNEELPVTDFQTDEYIGISSAAWVDVEHQEVSVACDSGPFEDTVDHVPSQPEPSSPRIRHSLSQMLQADSNEPEIIEWGNAENPPALVYQKDAPKGLKRLLKFARKNKHEANVTGCASPSVFSEGEDDTDDSKAANKKNVEISRKSSILQTKGFGQQKSMLNESLDGGSSSKRTVDYQGVHDDLSASLNSSNPTFLSSDKFREGHVSSTKAARSFFSLSTFRSNKSSDAKLR